MKALELQHISKYYTSQTSVVMGLADVSLSFSTGEFVAVTGENGSGKSTLANVIGGMLPYESGEMLVMGQPTSHYDAADWEHYRRDLISFISQDYGILPGNTVAENVESALVLSGHDMADARKKTADILLQVDLSEYAGRRASKLSSGQKQRLAIARALAKPSRILIADEPTGNLDRENSDRVISLLKEASKDRLVILITHEYDEAKEQVTRHIALSDGKIVQDIRVNPSCGEKTADTQTEGGAAANGRSTSQSRSLQKNLSSYIARLTAKARPVFLAFVSLILILTSVASFVFIGNFIIATDDVSSRIYDAKAFRNGDPKRIVLSKSGRAVFTDGELDTISGTRHVSSAEKYGYICDLNYYYREETDYLNYTTTAYGPNYDPVSNPDDYTLTNKVEFVDSDPLYLQSVSRAGTVSAGRMPETFYEVLSADPNVKTGTRILVFVRNRNLWSVSAYMRFYVDVVGETRSGRGLYFSESFCRMLNNSTVNGISNNSGYYEAGGDLGKYPIAPYEAERFSDVTVENVGEKDAVPVPETLSEDECLFPLSMGSIGMSVGRELTLNIGDRYRTDMTEDQTFNSCRLVCVGMYESAHPKLLLVCPKTYDRMTGNLQSDQVSVFIDDYAYAGRVIGKMEEMGYVAVSPFQQGSTKKDQTRENERLNLLRICLAAAILTLTLQLVLLKLVFASLNDHFRLLSKMGLRAKTAASALSRLFFMLTVFSELAGALVILLLNHHGYKRVVSIFKYMNASSLFLIFAVHFVFCAAAYLITAHSMKKQVFSVESVEEDIDSELLEEAAGT